MRWLSRKDYDRLMAIATGAQAQAEQMFGELRQRNADYRDLLDKYHALKASGATPAPVPTERAPADPVTTAINAVAGRNHALRGMMAHAAMEARRNGIADEVIVRQIYDGIPASEGLPA